jgi:Zn-dependent protease
MTQETIALALIWYVAFLLALTCHEAAHALAAKRGGDMTAHEAGQVTLNPLPHMRREPIGTIVAPLITFFVSGFMLGWASAPYDPLWQQRHPRRAALMALAGPAANFVLVLLAAAAIRGGIAAGWFAPPETANFSHMVAATRAGAAEAAAKFLSIVFSLNLMLGAFNLLPFPPLDGNTAVGLLLPERAALRFVELSRSPMFAFVGLIIAWRLFGEVAGLIFRGGLVILYPELVL